MAASGGGSDDEVVPSIHVSFHLPVLCVGGGLAERRVASVKIGTLRTGLADLRWERNMNYLLCVSLG